MRPILGGFGSLWVPRELQIYLCQFLMEVHTGLCAGPAFQLSVGGSVWSIRMTSTGALLGLRRKPSWLGNAVRSDGASLSAASDEPGCGVTARLWRVQRRVKS